MTPAIFHTMASCWQGLWAYRTYLLVFFLPIFLLPLPLLVPTKVRTWGSAYKEVPRGEGRDRLVPGWGILRTCIIYSSLLAWK